LRRSSSTRLYAGHSVEVKYQLKKTCTSTLLKSH